MLVAPPRCEGNAALIRPTGPFSRKGQEKGNSVVGYALAPTPLFPYTARRFRTLALWPSDIHRDAPLSFPLCF